MALTMHQIRKRNFDIMREKYGVREDKNGLPEFGRQARMATYLGIQPAYMSHLVTGIKQIGNNLARQFEEKFGLPVGWMDTDHASGVDPRSLDEQRFAAMALRLFRAAPKDAQAVMFQVVSEQFVKTKQAA